MSELHFTVGVIGLGLIGGSMALDLRRRGFAGKTLGVEKDQVAAEAARTIGLVDEVTDFEDCVRRSDIIVVAVPVGTAVNMVTRVLNIRIAFISSTLISPLTTRTLLKEPTSIDANFTSKVLTRTL
jgi:prephenate dehydrogenase